MRKADGFSEHLRNSGAGYQAYEQFSQHVVMPMVEAVAKLMAPHLSTKGAALALRVDVPEILATSKLWTKEQLKLAFHLYCQLPFGRLHAKNPLIIQLSQRIGRTPSALAMKLVNIASLDPVITSTGRKGLVGASKADRDMWAAMQSDWDGFAARSSAAVAALSPENASLVELPESDEKTENYFATTKGVLTQVRVGQGFFRRSVLSAYDYKCCITGWENTQMLVASHIVPWRVDAANRLNPSNGLSLSVLHDKAFWHSPKSVDK